METKNDESVWTLQIQNDKDVKILKEVDPESTLEDLFERLGLDIKKFYLFLDEKPLLLASKSLKDNKIADNALLTIFNKPEKLSHQERNLI